MSQTIKTAHILLAWPARPLWRNYRIDMASTVQARKAKVTA